MFADKNNKDSKENKEDDKPKYIAPTDSFIFAVSDKPLGYTIQRLCEMSKAYQRINFIRNDKIAQAKRDEQTMYEYIKALLHLDMFDLRETTAVQDYWNNLNKKKEKRSEEEMKKAALLHFDAMIIQTAFRLWIKLAQLRKDCKIANDARERIILVQTAARRFLARHHTYKKDIERKDIERKFQSFCLLLDEGISIVMFSKKYGDMKRITIKIETNKDSVLLLCEKTKSSKKYYDLSTVYEVCKGISDFPYSSVAAAVKPQCFHLKLLGGRALDFQAKDGAMARELFEGFTHLRLLLYTQSAYYIDTSGVPRRATASVIEHSLEKAINESEQNNNNNNSSNDNLTNNQINVKHNTCVSEADHMRYRNAIRMLKSEYQDWDDECLQEKAIHDAWKRKHHYELRIKKKQEAAIKEEEEAIRSSKNNNVDTTNINNRNNTDDKEVVVDSTQDTVTVSKDNDSMKKDSSSSSSSSSNTSSSSSSDDSSYGSSFDGDSDDSFWDDEEDFLGDEDMLHTGKFKDNISASDSDSYDSQETGSDSDQYGVMV